MCYLFSKFKTTRWLLIFLSPLLSLVFGVIFAGKFLAPNTILAQTATPDVACVADGLIKYMNVVVQETKDLSHIKLLSPAFNLTNPTEAAIFKGMVGGQNGVSGNFNDLDGFAGNTYSGVPGSPDTTAYQWYEQNFKNLFFPPGSSTNKVMVFTEYGDYDYNRNGAAGRANLINNIGVQQHRLAGQDPRVVGINYFNAINQDGFGNPEFTDRHKLEPYEYNIITQPYPDKSGVNSASQVTPGNFVVEANSYSSNVNWVVEIAYNTEDAATVASYAKKAFENGMVPVLRICKGNTCAFTDPNVYVQFIKTVDTLLTGTSAALYVLAGPNEPATELWATPGCIPTRPLEIRQIACNDTMEPEYHSLRPYPASATCPIQIESSEGMCGNDFVLQETITVNRTDPNTGCTLLDPSDPNAGTRCTFEVDRTVDVSVDLSSAELPIMGNTELVPNSVNPYGVMSYGQRMTEYVSWYLNGAIQRAEEPFADAGSAKGLFDLINFSGPLRKTLPYVIQNGANIINWVLIFPFDTTIIRGLRLKQYEDATNPGITRHNQIVSCGSEDNPTTCYSENSDYKRITSVTESNINGDNPNTTRLGDRNIKNILNNAFSYIPFSSTEDLEEKATLSAPSSDFTIGDVKVSNLKLTSNQPESGSLFFPHMQESLELAGITQDTFIPKSMIGKRDNPKTDDVSPPNMSSFEFCEFEEARSNPGDSLYGDVDRVGEDDEPQIKGTTSYTATFECEFRPTVDPNLYNQCMARGYCETFADCAGTWSPDLSCASGLGRCIFDPPYPDNNLGCQEEALTYPACTKTVRIPLEMNVNTPNADPIWARLVAGPLSVFRRFYPKTGAGSPVEKIKDLPAESTVVYSAAGGEGVTATAGDGSTGSTGSLYFPHIGGIQEYFLNGIQKALLPYGGSLPSGSNPPPGSTGGNCTINAPYSIASKAYQDMLVDAANKYNIPIGALIAVLWGENCRSSTVYNGQTASICDKSDAFLAPYLAPGVEYPHTAGCPGNTISDGSGVYQFMPIFWGGHPLSQPASSKICSIYDSTYAAAKNLAWTVTLNKNTVDGANWTKEDAEFALAGWVLPTSIDSTPCSNGLGHPFMAFYCNWLDDNWESTTYSCQN